VVPRSGTLEAAITRYRFTLCRLLGDAPPDPPQGDPATARGRSCRIMKADIHPQYHVTTVTCSCGNTFTTRSTAPNGTIHADVCSNCHPFYTGKQKILDTGGRVARFEKRFGKNPSTKPSDKK
jgi:large subunit ribosomal protein L31